MGDAYPCAVRPARSLYPELPLVELTSSREPAPGGVETSVHLADDRLAWVAIGVCIVLLAMSVFRGHEHAASESAAGAPRATEPPPVASVSAPAKVTSITAPHSFVGRRARVSPGTDIGVEVVPAADVIARIGPLGPLVPELILGRYEDAETGLILDPAWVVIDRGVQKTNVVRVVNAVTGRVAFTFSAPLGFVLCPIPMRPGADICA